jgi:hypothetical protein
MVNATEATTAMLRRMVVVIALIYRLINSSLVGWAGVLGVGHDREATLGGR